MKLNSKVSHDTLPHIITYISNDSPAKNGSLPQGRMQKLKVNAKGEAKVVIQPGGGLVLK